MMGEGIKQAFSGYVEWWSATTQTITNVLANLFPDITFFQDLQTGFSTMLEYIKSLPDLIFGFFAGLGTRLKGIFTNILPDWALEALGITPEVSGGGGLQPGGAVNDGVIQAGKIISTNPEDTLIATKQPGGLLDGIMSKVGGLFGGGEDGESGLSSAFNSIAEVLTTSLKGITSMVSGTGSEGGVAGISAEALQNTVLKMSSETLETKLDSLAEIQMNGATALTNAMLSLVDTLKATDIETNKKMIEKLEEVRKAVIIGSLIEMDGNILTQTVTQKQEAFNRVNFASRLKS
jgi:hypothetical protein